MKIEDYLNVSLPFHQELVPFGLHIFFFLFYSGQLHLK